MVKNKSGWQRGELIVLPPAYTLTRTELARLKFLLWLVKTGRVTEYPAAK